MSRAERRIGLGALGLAAAASGFGLAHNAFSPRGISLTRHPLEALASAESGTFVALSEAKAHFDRGVVFLDARAEAFYEEGHIRGALSLPVSDFETAWGRVEPQLRDRDAPLVCYCSGFGCEESIVLAERLSERGYRRVFVYLGGWPEWSEAGLPMGRSNLPATESR